MLLITFSRGTRKGADEITEITRELKAEPISRYNIPSADSLPPLLFLSASKPKSAAAR